MRHSVQFKRPEKPGKGQNTPTTLCQLIYKKGNHNFLQNAQVLEVVEEMKNVAWIIEQAKETLTITKLTYQLRIMLKK